MIYGDSINLDRQVEIYSRLEAKGFAATNVVLGIGSFSYVYMTRDQAGFAAKGAWFEIAEDPTGLYSKEKIGYNIYKDPVTDDGTKKSLKKLLQVYYSISFNEPVGSLKVKEECTKEEESKGWLQTIYEDGKFYNQTNLKEIRKKLTN